MTLRASRKLSHQLLKIFLKKQNPTSLYRCDFAIILIKIFQFHSILFRVTYDDRWITKLVDILFCLRIWAARPSIDGSFLEGCQWCTRSAGERAYPQREYTKKMYQLARERLFSVEIFSQISTHNSPSYQKGLCRVIRMKGNCSANSFGRCQQDAERRTLQMKGKILVIRPS